MNLSQKPIKVCLLTLVFLSLAVATDASPLQPQAPVRTNHVNDFAGIMDERNRQRLDRILESFERKSGIQFDVAMVQSTGGVNIDDYSQQLARDWDIGSFTTKKKSLLLVVSVGEKASFTRFSRSVQRDLPPDLLGQMSQRLRGLLLEDQFDVGLSDAVEYFVTSLGNKLSFTFEDIDRISANEAPIDQPAGNSEAPGTGTRRRQVTVPVNSTTEKVQATTIEATTTKPESAPIEVSATKTTTDKPQSRSVDPPRTKPSARATQEVASRKQSNGQKVNSTIEDEDESEEVELTLTLPLAERVVALKEFLSKHPASKSKPRAIELLVSAHAGLGDLELKSGNSVGGMEHFRLAVQEAPLDISEKLFTGVIAQIPMNLYLRNESVGAFRVAQEIETKFGNDARRLIGLANFYLGIERGDEAGRLADKAISLAPDLAEAHYILGVARHISLRIDEAIAEYKKAVELDPNLLLARRGLADLSRASGKSDEALAFYRERLTTEPKDKVARAGVILSLLDIGRVEEAQKELDAALLDDPKNVTLLAGVTYWFAAHGDTKRALELGRRAVEIEPRYTWSQIGLGRALIGERRPLDAERALRFARAYGKFPTLDYELATALAAAGLYEEAAEYLTPAFTLKEGVIEARLGGRTVSQSENFIDLLAPERRASIFQFAAADTPANARILKALLAFTIAASKEPESIDEKALTAAGKEFASGDDEMRVYRQLYVASRLLRHGKGFDTARELLEAARSSVDAGLDAPAATVAVQADELREIRSRAISSGGTPNIADAPRNVLSNILRGRIEDLTGWTLFNQDKAADAIDPLRRAVNVLPEGTPSWRTATWHLGAALEQAGSKEEALNYYIKSYISGERDGARRALIEQLYVKVNGSTDGLDQRIGPSPTIATPSITPAVTQPSPSATSTPELTKANAEPSAPQRSEVAPEPTPTPAQPTSTEPNSPPSTPVETPSPKPDNEPAPVATPKPESTEPANPSARPGTEPTLADMPPKVPEVLKLTGRIRDASGSGIGNVVVVLISPRGSVLASTTDSEGNYSFTVSPSEKPFRILPSKEGLTFDPVDRTLTITRESQKDVDFTGTPTRSP